VAMLNFLEINGLRVKATDPELADWILSFSVGCLMVEPPQIRHSETRNIRRKSAAGAL
jgi:prophage maintenance system killer protein